MSAQNLAIKYVPVDILNPAPYNPRTWDDSAKEQLRESISRFGMVDPLVVNGADERMNIVIGGHFRLAALKELGHDEVPIVYVHILDPFAGSCVTGEVCEKLGREWVCADLVEDYLKGAVGRFTSENTKLKTTEDATSKYYQIPRPGLMWNGEHGDPLPADGGKKRRIKKKK